MTTIFVRLENCYGIPSFIESFKFDSARNKGYLIYAPNGVMKTSFANTLNDICKNAETKDFFFPERQTTRIVKFGDEAGDDIEPEDILVIEPYVDNYKSENMSTLLADEELKNKYDRLHKEINEKMNKVISNLRKLSGKKDVEKILAQDFGFEQGQIFECLDNIFNDYQDIEILDLTYIRYGDLFTTDAEKLLQDEQVISKLEEYIEQYEKLLSQSNVFKVSFNHNSASGVLKTLQKEGFFKAKHRIALSDSEELLNEKEFKKIIDEEKRRILDNELAEEFERIDKQFSAKNGTKELRELIFNHKEIIPELIDIRRLKQKIWVSYLFDEKDLFNTAILIYRSNKKIIFEIIEKAKTQLSKWNDVVEQFNERFSNMPYTLDVENKEDVVLQKELPSISFKYKDRGETANVVEYELLQRLSNGEKKALYLLNIIFEVEARKELSRRTLVIMDDIADSFDYRNKYAIIEYIKEIVENELFMPIILTHNFDFYRTVAGRVNIKNNSNFVNKSDETIELIHGQYFENVFDSWRGQIYKNNAVFIASIPFLRNIVEYIDGKQDVIYKKMTSLLHFKKNPGDGCIATDVITNDQLIGWYCEELNYERDRFEQNKAQKVIDLIFTTAESIMGKPDETVNIENKIVLSIAIRQKAERYMIERINDYSKTDAITGNQTRDLRKMIEFNLNDSADRKVKEVIERVLIITSENIHINSFMYEPIVDMSLGELKNLYVDVEKYLIYFPY